MKKSLTFLVILLSFYSALHSQTNHATSFPPLLDPAYSFGKLENGIRYLILQDSNYQKKVDFTAYFNVGKLQENEDENGLFHLVEHLKVSGNLMLQFCKNYWVNAHTAPDEVSFFVRKVPSNNVNNIDTSLFFLKLCLMNLTFDAEKLKKEQENVISESREWLIDTFNNIKENIRMQALNGTRYGWSYQVEDTLMLRKVSIEKIRNFSQKWFKPDHLIIIVSGDIDSVEMIKKIKQVFGPIPKTNGPTPKIDYEIPDFSTPQIAISDTVFGKNSEIEIRYKKDKPKKFDINTLQDRLIDIFIYSLFEYRMAQISASPNAPFDKAYCYSGKTYFMNPLYREFVFKLKGNGQGSKKALEALLAENQRIIKYGFSEKELQMIIKNFLDRMKIRKFDYSKHHKIDSENCSWFLMNADVLVSYNFWTDYVVKNAQSVSLAEVNKRYSQQTLKQPVVLITRSEADSIPFTQKEIENLFYQAKKADVKPWKPLKDSY